MRTARRLAFTAILLAHAAAAIGLAACTDRPVEGPVQVATAAPPAPAPTPAPRATPAPPVEPEATPTPEERREFERTGPK